MVKKRQTTPACEMVAIAITVLWGGQNYKNNSSIF